LDDDGEKLGQRGKEFGTTTGRKRRCGWFDAVLVRQSVALGGVNGLALTKLDVLDDFAEIKLCVGYQLDGQPLDYLPSLPSQQARLQPIFEVLEGWQSSTEGARSWKDLPALAIKYIRRIEELRGLPHHPGLHLPKREDVILVSNPFGARGWEGGDCRLNGSPGIFWHKKPLTDKITKYSITIVDIIMHSCNITIKNIDLTIVEFYRCQRLITLGFFLNG
jgi:hypothetical protein